MVGAGDEVLVDLAVDGRRGTVGDQGVDEGVAARSVDIRSGDRKAFLPMTSRAYRVCAGTVR